MDKSSEFTPKESFHANLFKDPAALFRRTLVRKLTYIIPSVVLMVVWIVSQDPAYAYIGYGLLLYQAILGILQAWRGIQTSNRVITKYEQKIQGK
jgi:predicted TPR repeat methyltransferase